ncbi:MAG: hypothetical protein WCL44_12270, partial [bacterium]
MPAGISHADAPAFVRSPQVRALVRKRWQQNFRSSSEAAINAGTDFNICCTVVISKSRSIVCFRFLEGFFIFSTIFRHPSALLTVGGRIEAG